MKGNENKFLFSGILGLIFSFTALLLKVLKVDCEINLPTLLIISAFISLIIMCYHIKDI